MHKSRLGGLIIDCDTDDLAGAAAFWSRALGRSAVVSGEPGDEKYIGLDGPPTRSTWRSSR